MLLLNWLYDDWKRLGYWQQYIYFGHLVLSEKSYDHVILWYYASVVSIVWWFYIEKKTINYSVSLVSTTLTLLYTTI